MTDEAVFDAVVLCHGDYPQLARRCLESLAAASPAIARLVVILNDVSQATAEYVRWRVPQLFHDVRVVEDAEKRNTGKYRAIRSLLAGELAGSDRPLLWFDDDSYAIGPSEVVSYHLFRVADHLRRSPMDVHGFAYKIGLSPYQAKRLREVRTSAGPLATSGRILFATGGLWACSREFLAASGWPIPQLYHSGGDFIQGMCVKSLGGRIVSMDSNLLRVNADASGRASSSPTRGRKRQALWQSPDTPEDSNFPPDHSPVVERYLDGYLV